MVSDVLWMSAVMAIDMELIESWNQLAEVVL